MNRTRVLRCLGGWVTAVALLPGAQPVVLASGPPREIRAADPRLVPVPWPVLEGLEEAVGEQLEAAGTTLERVLVEAEATPAWRAAAYGRFGMICHAYQLWPCAAAAYTNARTLLPGHPLWTYAAARAADGQGENGVAIGLYREVLASAPDDGPARFYLGNALRSQGNNAAARVEFTAALRSAGTATAAQVALAELALDEGEAARAVELLTPVLAANPGASRLHYLLARAYQALGDRTRAAEHLAQRGETGIAVGDPLAATLTGLATGERVHLVRGRTAFEAGDFAAAVGAFRRALEADPASGRARLNLGVALVAADQPGEAAEVLRGLVEREPGYAAARLAFGAVLRILGDFEGALAQFEAAGPEFAESWRGRGDALAALGRFAEAAAALEEGFRRFPADQNLRATLAAFLERCPDPRFADPTRALQLRSAPP